MNYSVHKFEKFRKKISVLLNGHTVMIMLWISQVQYNSLKCTDQTTISKFIIALSNGNGQPLFFQILKLRHTHRRQISENTFDHNHQVLRLRNLNLLQIKHTKYKKNKRTQVGMRDADAPKGEQKYICKVFRVQVFIWLTAPINALSTTA